MMHNKNWKEELLIKSQQGLFPDIQFEGSFKSGNSLDGCFLKRDYRIRLAVPEDIDILMEIESHCWAVDLQTGRDEIAQRLIEPACFNFVLEYESKVISVIYSQRISKEDIKKVKPETLYKIRNTKGDSMQLIALNMLPRYQEKGWGYELLEFVLQYFSLDPDIHAIYAVTRCRDFMKSNCATIQEYLQKIYQNGILNDPILNLHQSHGAKVLGLLEQYRPKDEENQGYGVLVKYDIKNRPWRGKGITKREKEKKKNAGGLFLNFLKQKQDISKEDMEKNLQDIGLDSLDFTELLVFMNEKLGVAVSMRDLNEKNISELQYLCEGGENPKDHEEESQPLKIRMRSLLLKYPELVPLSVEGEGPCTFWIHPLSGDVGIYNGLANQADGTFRMMAIKARGFLSVEHEPLKSVTDMAKYYCEIISEVEPKGPYHLAGFSFGGTIAYEMACQLQQQGKKIANLLLVEAPYIDGNEPGLFETTYRNNLLMNANFLLLSLLTMQQKPFETDLNNGKAFEVCQITAEDVQDIVDEELEPYLIEICRKKGLRQTKEELEFKLRSMSMVHRLNLRAIQNYQAHSLLNPEQINAWLFRTNRADAVSEHIWNPDYLERVQREKGSFLPLLRKWEEVLPNLQTILLEGSNHFDVLHSQQSILNFYQYCRKIFTRSMGELPALEAEKDVSGFSVAIVGMSGRFPDADNIREFWKNLKKGRHSIRSMPKDRGFDIDDYFDKEPKTPGKTYSKWGGFLSDIDRFDPLFFKISPSDAQLMDPSERIFIQEAWKAIEDAGYNPSALSGKKWGVFACAKGDYSIVIQKEQPTYYQPTDSYAASRLSYLLNLEGPAISIDTACSSTLSVIAQACNSLELGECETAIAGGGAVYATPNLLIGSSQSLLLSPDGQCYTFDERANGTVVAESIGAVILKPLDQAIKDKDTIYGVIKGWGMNQDGRTNGMTAPSGRAQSSLQTGIYEKFHINPREITMLEAHGTGTKLGDAIEYQALTESFRKFTSDAGYCALGSLKTNIGHAFFGAGVAGVIKVLLSIKHRQIPPSLNYEKPSNKIITKDSPFFVNTSLREWDTKPGQPRCAAINAFGATGTNVHLVIEEYLSNQEKDSEKSSKKKNFIIVLSAKEKAVLKEYAEQFVKALEEKEYTDEMLQSISYTLQTGREGMSERLAMTVASIQEMAAKLKGYINGISAGVDFYQNEMPCRKNDDSSLESEIQEAIQEWSLYKNADKLLMLWVNGADVDWESLYHSDKPEKISLPAYPFAKQRCWLKSKENMVEYGETPPVGIGKKEQQIPDIGWKESFELMSFTEEWTEETLRTTAVRELKTVICFLSKAENQDKIKEQIKAAHIIFISQGTCYEKKDPFHYVISNSDKSCYHKLLQDIAGEYQEVSAIVYLWACEDPSCIVNCGNIIYLLQAVRTESVNVESLVLGGMYETGLEKCYLDSWIGFERSIGPMMLTAKVKVVFQEKKAMGQKESIEEYAENLCKEMKMANITQSALYSAGKRYVCKVKELEAVSEETPQVCPLKTRGTYLITGGLGKLGMIFAKYLVRRYQANLILCGRSALKDDLQKILSELEMLGGHVHYIQADICDYETMKKGLETAKEKFGEIQGILHTAGLVNQKSIFQKNLEEVRNVLSPKITGTLLLDKLLGGRPRDFICYFSSAAAIMGDFGACDYAVGNRFQMAYTRYKNNLERQNNILGKTVVVNWPVWREGGMKLSEEDNEIYLQSSGQRYLETEEGINVFEKLLSHAKTQHLILAGQKDKIAEILKIKKETLQAPSAYKKKTADRVPAEKRQLDLREYLEQEIKILINKKYQIPIEKLDSQEQLVEYGFDSINIFEFARTLSNTLEIEVSPSTLLSYATIGKLTDYLIDEYGGHLSDYDQEEVKGQQEEVRANPDCFRQIQTEPIAVIGMSGRFPQAGHVDALWENLRKHDSCIKKVPENRWDLHSSNDSQIDDSIPRWGGFLDDLKGFDPLFFKISPKEAHIMDPCQRIFLEEAWHALEDAGYMGERIKGKSCGVYVGIEEGEYGFLARQEGLYYSNQNSVLSARIAYELDLKGPNLSVDASCSSGLAALHQACQALRCGDCEMALAGGINLLITPAVHIGMSKLELLSPNGKSYVFDERAEGMVPGEAVAAVLLKPLSRAIHDKDHIYGCIKGSGINNNGSGQGMMSPNPLRQAELINEIFDKYHISPLQLQYLISHSVGTKLSDAAEVDGLKMAFQKYSSQTQYCHIGSVKPVIGHTFAASGIVSLIAMLLAMKNKTILGLPYLEKINENIDFSKTPFIACKDDRIWETKENLPRLGAVSTSANNGTNAFAVIEEYISPIKEENLLNTVDQQQIFIFSATDREQLHKVVNQMFVFIKANDVLFMPDLAYTLQIGREPMACRTAMLAKNREELLLAMSYYQYCIEKKKEAGISVIRIFAGNAELLDVDASEWSREQWEDTILLKINEPGNLEKTAVHWSKGGNVKWEVLYGEMTQRQILSLPLYPFKSNPYWLSYLQEESEEKRRQRSSSPEQPIQEIIKSYFMRFFSENLYIREEDLDPDRLIQDYGADSILMMKLIREFEEQFDYRISGRDTLKYPSIRLLTDYLAGELKKCKSNGHQRNPASEESEMYSEKEKYQDGRVIDAMELYVRGAISLEDLEKRVGEMI